MNLPHSSGKPGASSTTINISVRFVADEPIYFQIKHLMKTSFQENHIHPALFRIAAIFENPINEIYTSAKLKREFEAFRREIAKSRDANIVKPQLKMRETEGCGWSFPFPIRK